MGNLIIIVVSSAILFFLLLCIYYLCRSNTNDSTIEGVYDFADPKEKCIKYADKD